MPIPDKLCLYCKHFYMNVGEPDYSELTPGSDFDINCGKGHWDYKPYHSEGEYFRCIHSAMECRDYEERERTE